MTFVHARYLRRPKVRLAIEELVPTGPALETEGKLDTGCTSTATETEAAAYV